MSNEAFGARGEETAPQANTVAFSHSEASPDVRVLIVRGELDISTSGLLQHELDDLLDAGVPRVEVDLSGVVFMDSSALSALVGAHERAGTRGQHLALLSPSPACAKVLGITGLDRVFDLI
jgi:anti-sigma B factor antagonist